MRSCSPPSAARPTRCCTRSISVAVPKPNGCKVPLAYIIAGRDEPLVGGVNTWIDLKRKDGTIDELFAHWILGRDALAHVRRWSILDDVLGWGR